MIRNRAGDGDPAPVCQWSDDQSACGTQILISIVHLSSYLPDDSMLSVLDGVLQLLLPCEIVDRLYLVCNQIGYNVPIVHVGCDQCYCYFVIDGILESALNEFCQCFQLFYQHLVPAV